MVLPAGVAHMSTRRGYENFISVMITSCKWEDEKVYDRQIISIEIPSQIFHLSLFLKVAI